MKVKMNLRLLLVLAMVACQQKEMPKIVEYNGPLREAANVDVLYTEKDHIKVKMQAKKILEFKNGDQEFPEGLYLEFFSDQGVMTSTLKANHAYYFKEQKQWRGRGDVEVKNIQKQQQLDTEELFWEPETKKIFTEKFVTITLESEVISGTGLDATQDLSSYTIRKPEAIFDIKD